MEGSLGFESFSDGRWKWVGVGVRVWEGEQIKFVGSGWKARVGGRRGIRGRVVLKVGLWSIG